MSEKILFQGDSITDFFRSREDDSKLGMGYSLLVSSELGFENPCKYEFINRGISGNRIVDVYARMKVDILKLKPDYMSLLIGVNDVWHENYGNGVSEKKFEKIYTMLLEEIFEELPDIKIMLLEPFVLEGVATESTEENPTRWETFNKEVRLRAAAAKRVAEKFNLPFITLQDKFDEALKQAPSNYWLYDGVHPTPNGHELIKREWIKTFKTL